MIRCLLIDPGKTILDALQKYIRDIPGFLVCGACRTIPAARLLLREEKPGLFILDINLPGAADFLRDRPGGSCVILLSHNAAFALESYEFGACDYLLKPLVLPRFLKALEKAESHLQAAAVKLLPAEKSREYFFVRSAHKFEKINRDEILYIEGMQNYITIQLEHKKVITYSSLKNIETYLPEYEFLRVQRSFIISVPKIDSIERDEVVIGKKRIVISRSLKEHVLQVILNDCYYKHQA